MNLKKEKEIRSKYSKLNKESRCLEFSKSKSIPVSYKENTLKEELVLEHLIQYRKEFSQAIDPKRDLFLYPMNESRKYKFICTTVRPTKVPYPELYNFDKCAKFISDFIEYEELSPPNEFPKYIPAPDNVLKWQIGDCFDIAIVLCSILLGVGYNAYVVYGKAPRYITTKDQSNLECPDLSDDIKIIEPNLNISNKQKLIKIEEYEKPKLSDYENKTKEDKLKKDNEDRKKNFEIDDDKPEIERRDPWEGKRLHCWVLIKSNNRLENKNYFIDPISGRIYNFLGIKKESLKDNSTINLHSKLNLEFNKLLTSKSDQVEETYEEYINKGKKNSEINVDDIEKYIANFNPFETIDAVFNHINFWINLKPEDKIDNIEYFNLLNNERWEHVMLTDKTSDDNDDKYIEALNNIEDNNDILKLNSVVDMPPPWPNKLYISQHAYYNKTPLPTQTFYYKKTKVDKYSTYSQPDGKVMNICSYDDYARLRINKVESRYRNRYDKLYKTIKYPYLHKIQYYYLPGQLNGWKIVEEVEANYKTIYYYETNYKSGLIYRHEIFGQSIIHGYKSRDDKIYERKVFLKENIEVVNSKQFLLDSPLYENKLLIDKFYQEYTTNPLSPPEQQIARLVFFFSDSYEIKVTYHFAKDKIKAETDKFYDKENESTMGEDENDNIDNIKQGSDREKLKKKLISIKKDSLTNFIKIEDEYNFQLFTYSEYLKKMYKFKNNLLENKGDIFENQILEKHLFDRDLDDSDKQNKIDKDYTGSKHRFDRIEFFYKLEKEKKGKHADPKEIKDAVINIFKEEKMHVTNILQAELKEKIAELNKEIEEFKLKETTTVKDLDNHNERINDIHRMINIIYQRSHRHITNIMSELNYLMDMTDMKNA